jgi:hypothetical protein
MSVLNRKMFKPRNARNALNRAAGIPSVAMFQTGGSTNPLTRRRTLGTTTGLSGLPGIYTAPKFTGPLARANVGELAQRYISGKPLTASEFSVLRGAERGFLKGRDVDQSMGQFGKTRLGSGIRSILKPMAQGGGNILGFLEGATGTAAKTLLGSSDGSMPADKAAGPQLNKDYLESLGINFLDPTNLQTASSRGGPVPPSAFGKAVPPPAAPKSQEELDADAKRAEELNREEAIARAEMERIGSVVGNEEAGLSPTGFLPTTTPSLESATDNAAQAARLAAGKDIEDGDVLIETEATVDDGGEDDATPGTGTGTGEGSGVTGAPNTQQEINDVINKGTQVEQTKALDGFIKEFMDKAPGYEGADSGLILAKIGFAMAAGKSPNAIENIASAMSDGADMLIKDKAKKDEFNRQLKLSALQYGLTETSKISAEERAVKRADADVVEMVVGQGGTTYKGRNHAEGESVFISKGDLKAGSFPPNILGTSGVTALKNKATANAAALKAALDQKKITPAEYTKQIEKYSKAVTTAIDSESGIALLEGAMVTVTDGNVTGMTGVFKDMVRGGGAFLNMDLSKEYGDKKAVRDAMRAALQDVIPVTLGSTQTANSISNRDVDFLIEAYFGAGALNGGILTFAAETETDLVKRMQRAIGKMRNSQKSAFSTMKTTEQFLTPLLQPGTDRSAASLLSEDQRRLQEAGLRAGGGKGAGVYVGGQLVTTQTGATRGDDGIIRYNLG